MGAGFVRVAGMFRIVALGVLPFLLVVQALVAEVTLHHDFDNGALVPERSYVDGDWVYLDGPDNFNAGRWKWIYFRADGVAGRALRFRIGSNFATGASRLSDLRMVYREAGGEWEFFEYNVLNTSAGTFTFYNDAAFTADSVEVSFSFPYPVSRAADLVAEVSQTPWGFQTASTGDDFILGMSPGGIDDRGRQIGPLPLYGFMITDPNGIAEKQRIVLCSGVHSNETLGTWVLEGLVRWLVGDDPRAAALRREVEFYVYPMVNADGRYAGYNRGGVAWPSRDTNRFWREDLYVDMDDIRQVAEAMKADTGAERVSWFADFHSWSDTGAHFVIMNPAVGDTVFWQELKRMEPDMGRSNTTSTTPTSRRFAMVSLGATYSLIPETMFRPGEYPERYLAMGERFGIAWFHQVNPGGFKDPDANVLVLARAGDPREAEARAFGAWLAAEGAAAGVTGVDVSADLVVNVLDSAGGLSEIQQQLLEMYDLVIVPPIGAGPAADFGSADWNAVRTPILNLNGPVAGPSHWGWFGSMEKTVELLQEMVIADLAHPVLGDLDTAGGTVQLHPAPGTLTTVARTDSTVLNGRVVGWTDHETAGINPRFPALVFWEGDGATPFYAGGSEAPAQRRTYLAGPDAAIPDSLTAAGRQLLLNAVARTRRTRILMLVSAGHSAEANVREMGAWLASEGSGRYSVDFSADLTPDVLVSSSSLSTAQRAVLERYDLILMPRFGVGSAGNFASTDWNTITTPLLCMNAFMMASNRWGWVPAGISTVTTPTILDLVVVQPDSPLLVGLDTSQGRVPMLERDLGILQVPVDSNLLTGQAIGWTDIEDGGENRRNPWIVFWDGNEPAFHHGAGGQAPAGRRMLFLSPQSNAPGEYSAQGLAILLNAVENMSSPQPRPATVPGFQQWRHSQFTQAQLANRHLSGPAGDATGGGTPNLLKYLLGLGPHDEGQIDLPKPEVRELSLGGEDTHSFLTVSFRSRSDISDVAIRVEASTDLRLWTEDAVLYAEDTSDPAWRWQHFRASAPLEAETERFLRLSFEPLW